jgi:hypothetical protein
VADVIKLFFVAVVMPAQLERQVLDTNSGKELSQAATDV